MEEEAASTAPLSEWEGLMDQEVYSQDMVVVCPRHTAASAGCESSHLISAQYHLAAVAQCPTPVYSVTVHVHRLPQAPLEPWAPQMKKKPKQRLHWPWGRRKHEGAKGPSEAHGALVEPCQPAKGSVRRRRGFHVGGTPEIPFLSELERRIRGTPDSEKWMCCKCIPKL